MDEGLRSACALEEGVRPLRPWHMRLRRGLRAVLPCFAAALIAGCAVSKALERAPGVDLSPVKAGATRGQVEGILGEPLRQWTTSAGIRYCLYRYDAGIEPNTRDAGAIVFLDIISLGLYEAIDAFGHVNLARAERKYRLIAVSYDSQGTVIGSFKDIGEFTPLPEDGRPPAPQAPDTPPPSR